MRGVCVVFVTCALSMVCAVCVVCEECVGLGVCCVCYVGLCALHVLCFCVLRVS